MATNLLDLFLQLFKLIADILVKVVSYIFDHSLVLQLTFSHHCNFSFNNVDRFLQTVHTSIDFTLDLRLKSLQGFVNSVFHVLYGKLIGTDLDVQMLH